MAGFHNYQSIGKSHKLLSNQGVTNDYKTAPRR